MDFNNKKYTIWTDETMWRKHAVECGLRYGVYNKELRRCCTREEQGGIIVSIDDARRIAIEMNEALENKLKPS